MTKYLAVLFAAFSLASALAQSSTPVQSDVVFRTTKAMHYRPGGSSKIAFRGTDLMQRASGEAHVESKKTNIAIDAKFEGLDDATKFGLEYLTYVLWAVSPQGRAINLGELSLDHGKAHLKAFTDLQTFGMVVTAEPYSAVSHPGNMVVMENSFAEGAGGEEISAKYELLRSGTYSSTNTRIDGAIFGIDSKTPLALFEARNAVRIARVAQADRYAASILAKAEQQLRLAEEAYRQKQARTSIEAAAREAAQTAEESRVMAVKQKAEEEAQAQAAAEKRAAEERATRARADAESQTRARAEAEQARADAERARAEAQQAAHAAAVAAGERLAFLHIVDSPLHHPRRHGRRQDIAHARTHRLLQEAERGVRAEQHDGHARRLQGRGLDLPIPIRPNRQHVWLSTQPWE